MFVLLGQGTFVGFSLCFIGFVGFWPLWSRPGELASFGVQGLLLLVFLAQGRLVLVFHKSFVGFVGFWPLWSRPGELSGAKPPRIYCCWWVSSIDLSPGQSWKFCPSTRPPLKEK